MENLGKLLKMVDSEIGAITQNGKFRAQGEIDCAYKLIDIAKDIHCILKYEDEYDEEYEQEYQFNGYSRGNSPHYEGNSYRGRANNAKRDRAGRYSRGGRSMDSKEEYIEHLRDMRESAPDDQTRRDIDRMIQKMENA